MLPPSQPLKTSSAFKMIATVIVVLGLLISNVSGAQAETVRVWVYHNFPPYIVDSAEKTGLSYDLAQELTKRSGGVYEFDVAVVPRARLNVQLEQGDAVVVFWVNPIWFGDTEETKYLWSSDVTSASSVVISNADDPVVYDGPRTLLGMELIGIAGHRYSGIDELVNQNLMTRKDLHAESSAVQFIAAGRGRIAIIERATAEYFVREMGLEQLVHFSAQPHATYTRHVLVQNNRPALHSFIDQALDDLRTSETWQEVLANNQLEK